MKENFWHDSKVHKGRVILGSYIKRLLSSVTPNQVESRTLRRNFLHHGEKTDLQ